MVQILNSGDYQYADSSGIYSCFTGAPFPLLDNLPGSTTPFAHNNKSNPLTDSDTPAMPIPLFTGAKWASMNLNMTDYVMYNGGGMWVPFCTFTWSIDALASFWSPPVINNVNNPKVNVLVLGSKIPRLRGDHFQYVRGSTA